jgi:hypothetical protein
MNAETITKEDLQVELQTFRMELLEDLTPFMATSPINKKDWLTKKRVRKILRISRSTFQYLKTNGDLVPTCIGGKNYYWHAHILTLLDKWDNIE